MVYANTCEWNSSHQRSSLHQHIQAAVYAIRIYMETCMFVFLSAYSHDWWSNYVAGECLHVEILRFATSNVLFVCQTLQIYSTRILLPSIYIYIYSARKCLTIFFLTGNHIWLQIWALRNCSTECHCCGTQSTQITRIKLKKKAQAWEKYNRNWNHTKSCICSSKDLRQAPYTSNNIPLLSIVPMQYVPSSGEKSLRNSL